MERKAFPPLFFLWVPWECNRTQSNLYTRTCREIRLSRTSPFISTAPRAICNISNVNVGSVNFFFLSWPLKNFRFTKFLRINYVQNDGRWQNIERKTLSNVQEKFVFAKTLKWWNTINITAIERSLSQNQMVADLVSFKTHWLILNRKKKGGQSHKEKRFYLIDKKRCFIQALIKKKKMHQQNIWNTTR